MAAKFDKLLIPYNGDQNIVDWNDYKVVADGVFSKTKNNGSNNQTYAQQTGFTTTINTGWTEISDPANLFNPSNGEYTTPQWVGVGSGESYIYEATVQGSLSINPLQNMVYNDGGKIIKYKPFLMVNIGTEENVKCYAPSIILPSSATVYAPGVQQIGTFNLVFTFNGANDFQGGIDVNDIQIIQTGIDIRVEDSNGTYVNSAPYWNNSPLSSPTTAPAFVLDLTSINLTIRPSDNIPLNSGITTMNNFIPEKIKQSDFIKSIFMMYNLYATANPNNQNNLILISRDEYYDAGKAVDWTNNTYNLSSFFTSSTQAASSQGDYVLAVYQTSSVLDEAAIQFYIGYANALGSGSTPYDSAIPQYSPSSTRYGQWRNLILEDENSAFIFGNTTGSQFYIVSVERANYKQSLLPGSLNLTLRSGSNYLYYRLYTI